MKKIIIDGVFIFIITLFVIWMACNLTNSSLDTTYIIYILVAVLFQTSVIIALLIHLLKKKHTSSADNS
jgi:uncharacterized membrane protein YvlD (DUF360 family)